MPTAAHPLERALAGVTDFSDRLQPFLVKEMRRALRSGLFVLSFSMLPVALGFGGLWVVAQPDDDVARRVLSTVLWFAVVIPLYGLKPLQALQAMRRERASHSLDLLIVSRQQPIDILLGKWAALEVQSLLYLTAILPFFVLRYFLGRVELASVGVALLASLIWTSFLTVVCLSVSSFRRAGYCACTCLLALTSPLLLLPADYLHTTLRASSGGLSVMTLITLAVVTMVLAGFGFIAFASAAGSITPLPTCRDYRVAAAQRLKEEAAVAPGNGRPWKFSA